MKIIRLLDPAADAGGGTTPTTTTTTTNQMVPQPPAEDNFLDDTKPAEQAAGDGSEQPEKKETVVVDPNKPADKPVTYTPEQVAELVARAKPTLPLPTSKPAAKPMTQEEIDKQLKTYKPVAADIADLLSGDEPRALGALNRIGTALVQNAVAVANVLHASELAKLRAEYEPHVNFAQEQQRIFAQQRYFADNPTHVGLEPLVAQVAQQMVGEKFNDTPANTMKEVGKRVDALIEKLKIPREKPAGGTVESTTGKPAATRMSTVTTGGQGGAGGAGAAAKDKDPEADIWK